MTNASLAAQAVAWTLAHADAIAAGGRLALILFAVMSVLAWLRNRGEATPMERWRRRGWSLLALAVMAGSPIRIALAMGYTVPSWVESFSDLLATTSASACFMCSLAARGFMRGLSEQRVRRGAWVNVAVLLAVVGAATWLNR